MMFGGCQTNRKQVENKRYIIIFVGSRKGAIFAPSSIVNEILKNLYHGNYKQGSRGEEGLCTRRKREGVCF